MRYDFCLQSVRHAKLVGDDDMRRARVRDEVIYVGTDMLMEMRSSRY